MGTCLSREKQPRFKRKNYHHPHHQQQSHPPFYPPPKYPPHFSPKPQLQYRNPFYSPQHKNFPPSPPGKKNYFGNKEGLKENKGFNSEQSENGHHYERQNTMPEDQVRNNEVIGNQLGGIFIEKGLNRSQGDLGKIFANDEKEEVNLEEKNIEEPGNTINKGKPRIKRTESFEKVELYNESKVQIEY